MNGSETFNEVLFTEMWIGSKELTRDVEVTEASNHGKLHLQPQGPRREKNLLSLIRSKGMDESCPRGAIVTEKSNHFQKIQP